MKTLQLDLCRRLETKYITRDNLPNITWAGVFDLSIAFDDERMPFLFNIIDINKTVAVYFIVFFPANEPPHVTGYDHMKVDYPDINPIHDQFVMRVMQGKIVTEQVNSTEETRNMK